MDTESSVTPLEQAVAIIGSQAAFGKLLGVGQASISKWITKGRPLPAEHVLLVERATGVPKEQLRPDIYPPELSPSPLVEPGA